MKQVEHSPTDNHTKGAEFICSSTFIGNTNTELKVSYANPKKEKKSRIGTFLSNPLTFEHAHFLFPYQPFSGQAGCWDSQVGFQGEFKEQVQLVVSKGEEGVEQLAGEVDHQVEP